MFSLLLYLIAFVHYDKESYENTYVIVSEMKNIRYDSNHYISIAILETYYGDFYYKFYNRSNARDDYQTLVNIKNDNAKLQLVITKEKDYANLISLGKFNHIVEIKDEETVYFSIKDHNNDQLFRKIIYSIFATILLFICIAYCFITKYLFIK